MPYNKSPTDTVASGPITTATTDGGIMVPSEPPAQIVPEIIALL